MVNRSTAGGQVRGNEREGDLMPAGARVWAVCNHSTNGAHHLCPISSTCFMKPFRRRANFENPINSILSFCILEKRD